MILSKSRRLSRVDCVENVLLKDEQLPLSVPRRYVLRCTHRRTFLLVPLVGDRGSLVDVSVTG